MPDTCPKCGAEAEKIGQNITDFLCGSTVFNGGKFLERPQCLRNQLTALQEKLANVEKHYVSNLVYKDLQREYAELEGKYRRAVDWLKTNEWSKVDGGYDLHCIECAEPHPAHYTHCELAAILKEST